MTDKSNSRIWLPISVLLVVTLCTAVPAKTIYVDADAAGANKGTSWGDAYMCLQDALSDANFAEKPVEIRIASGIYKADQRTVMRRTGLEVSSSGDPNATFRLSDNVAIKGGYAGLGEVDPNTRDIATFETILSGDLRGDDAEVPDANSLLNDATRRENSYHVVTASNIGSSAVMDGLTITGGNANGEQKERTLGGGLYCLNSRIEIAHSVFRGNTSAFGGAIFNDNLGVLTVENCYFIRNSAAMLGGAIDNTGGSSILVMEDCTFTENHARSSGGAIMTGSSNPTFTRCLFEHNSSARGGGIYNFMGGNPTLVDCMFIGNAVEHFGGGMYNNSGVTGPFLVRCTFEDNFAGWYGGGFYNSYSGRPLIENCIFVTNSSSHWGGAIHFWRSTGEIRNCTVVNNSAQRGGALGCGFEDEIVPSNVEITNCILWGNGEEIYNDDNSQISIAYSCVEDLISGRFGLPDGNINEDPCFAEVGHWDANGVWVDGDHHLKSQAGRWDPNNENWVIDDVTSPCIDAGDPSSPVGDEPQPNGGRINMGAYGGTAEASKSLSAPASAMALMDRKESSK
jgi:predicted outer membrane repeat protein